MKEKPNLKEMFCHTIFEISRAESFGLFLMCPIYIANPSWAWALVGTTHSATTSLAYQKASLLGFIIWAYVYKLCVMGCH